MQKPITVFLLALLLMFTLPAIAQDNAAVEITILAKQNLALHSKPNFYSNVLGIFESGKELKTFGRDAEGGWLQTAEGWVNARNIAADGNIMTLQQTADAVTLQASAKLDLRGGPDSSYGNTETLAKGKLTIAIGRNHDGTWLETPKGWILASEVDFDGDTMALPVSFASITVTAAKNAAFLNAPTWEGDVLEIFPRGAEAFAYERTGDADWVKTPTGWVHIARGMEISGDLMNLPVAYIVSVTASSELSVFAGPGTDYGIAGSVQEGEETLAMRRTEDGAWLEIPTGWVSAESVVFIGDLLRLPMPPAGINVIAKHAGNVTVRTLPAYSGGSSVVARLQRGEEALAIGRNEKGNWLQLRDGWVSAGYFEADGDIMTLPVTDGTTTTTASRASTPRSTPTPTPQPTTSSIDARTIRTLVSRHTKDIRILDITIASRATTIEYDLKPWPFVPNEQIADEVAFKVICAIRNGQRIPNTLRLIGQSHFKSDVGRRFKSPSVEIHISAANANRVVCRGNDAADINWRSLATRYKSYPIPSGASVDYD